MTTRLERLREDVVLSDFPELQMNGCRVISLDDANDLLALVEAVVAWRAEIKFMDIKLTPCGERVYDDAAKWSEPA